MVIKSTTIDGENRITISPHIELNSAAGIQLSSTSKTNILRIYGRSLRRNESDTFKILVFTVASFSYNHRVMRKHTSSGTSEQSYAC